MRARRIKTLLFYAVLLYVLYRIFLAEEPTEISEAAQVVEEAIQTPIEHA